MFIKRKLVRETPGLHAVVTGLAAYWFLTMPPKYKITKNHGTGGYSLSTVLYSFQFVVKRVVLSSRGKVAN